MRGQQCTAAIISSDSMPVPPPPSPDPHKKVFINKRAFFSNNDAVIPEIPVGRQARGPTEFRYCVFAKLKSVLFFVFFSACEWAQMMHLAIGSNLCWKSRPDCTQAHWKPDEFGSQCFESTCVLRASL